MICFIMNVTENTFMVLQTIEYDVRKFIPVNICYQRGPGTIRLRKQQEIFQKNSTSHFIYNRFFTIKSAMSFLKLFFIVKFTLLSLTRQRDIHSFLLDYLQQMFNACEMTRLSFYPILSTCGRVLEIIDKLCIVFNPTNG